MHNFIKMNFNLIKQLSLGLKEGIISAHLTPMLPVNSKTPDLQRIVKNTLKIFQRFLIFKSKFCRFLTCV